MAFTSDLDPERRGALLDEWLEVRREIARQEARAASLLAERARLMEEDIDEHPMHRESIRRSTMWYISVRNKDAPLRSRAGTEPRNGRSATRA